MLRRWRRSLVALLAGSGLLAAVDGALQLAFPGHGLWRELAVLGVLGAWLAGGFLYLGLVLGSLIPTRHGRRPLPSAATCFWAGAAVGMVPLAASLLRRPLPDGVGPLPVEALGGLCGLALLLAAPRFGRVLAPGRLAAPLVALLAALALVSPWLPGDFSEEPLRTAVPAAAVGAAAEASGPDVLLVSVDTLRADAVVGAQSAPVPYLDRLRREGIWADFALASSNQTLPGHLGMLTGLDAMGHGVRSNYEVPRPDLVLLAERFQHGGWATAGVVSNGLISRWLGFHRGFESFDDSLVSFSMLARALHEAVDRSTWVGWFLGPRQLDTLLRIVQHSTLRQRKSRGAGAVLGERVTQRALGQLDRLLARRQPYFLFVHYMDAHAPYLAPPAFRGRLTAGLARPDERWFPAPGTSSKECFERLKADLAQGTPGAAEAAAWYRLYYLESVSWVDHCLGRLLERIEAAGRPTVVLFTGDHGEHFGEHALLEHANSLFEENLRVPFVLWGAGVEPLGRLAEPVHLRDVAPTLLDLAGLQVAGLEGRRVHWAATVAAPAHVATEPRWLSVRHGSWKWIGRWREDGAPEPIGLYHLGRDPHEQHDLSATEQAPEQLLAAVQEALQRDRWRPRDQSLSAAQAAALEAMGYVDAGADAAQPAQRP